MLDIEHEIIETDFGIKLLKSESSNPQKGVILHLHGLPGGPAEDHKDLHSLFATRGYVVFSFNYPGLWRTSGIFNISSSIDATKQVYNYLKDKYDGELLIFAESFGGVIITHSIQEGLNPSHVFYRAPLPGLQYFVNNEQLMNQLMTSFALLIQSGIINVGDTTKINEVLGNYEIDQPFSSQFSSNLSSEENTTRHYLVTGRNDEILSHEKIVEGYEGAKMKIFDNLSHNSISRSQWIEIVTLADIFFQS